MSKRMLFAGRATVALATCLALGAAGCSAVSDADGGGDAGSQAPDTRASEAATPLDAGGDDVPGLDMPLTTDTPEAPDARPATGWTFAGGGVHGGGFQNVLAFAPDNHDLVLSGSDVSGVQRSTDGGQHWALSVRGLNSNNIAALVFDPDAAAHPGRAYVGVGEGDGTVAMTDDYGATWTDFCPGNTACPDFQSNNGVPGQTNEHPRSTGHLIEVVHPTATTTCLLAATYDQGLERSMNGGAWAVLGLARAGGTPHYLRGLAYDAATDTAYLASVGPVQGGFASNDGVYRVTNACGAHPGTPIAIPGAPARVEELAWISGALYSAGAAGVARYTPGGAWSPMNNGLPLSGIVIYESIAGIAQGSGVVLFVGATNATGGNAILRWNGTTWTSISDTGDFSTDILGITPNETWWLTGIYLLDGGGYVASQLVLDTRAGSPRLWVAGRSGVYRSTGCDASFDHCTLQPSVNQMGVAVGRAIGLDPKVDGVAFYGDTDYTIFSSTDGLVHVDHHPSPASGNCRALAVDSLSTASVSPVYIGVGDRNGDDQGAVYVNPNPAGANGAARGAWTEIPFVGEPVDMHGMETHHRIWSLVAGHPTGASGTVLLATLDGGLGLWRSVGGAQFQRISAASSAMAGMRLGYYQAAAFYWPASGAHVSSQRVYLYDFGSGLYCSDDGGQSFTTHPVWAQTGNRSSIAGDPADPSRFYLSNGNNLYRFNASGTCADASLNSPTVIHNNGGAAFGGLASVAMDANANLWVPASSAGAGQLWLARHASTNGALSFTDVATDDYRDGGRSIRDLVVDHRGYIYMARTDNAVFLGTPN